MLTDSLGLDALDFTSEVPSWLRTALFGDISFAYQEGVFAHPTRINKDLLQSLG